MRPAGMPQDHHEITTHTAVPYSDAKGRYGTFLPGRLMPSRVSRERCKWLLQPLCPGHPSLETPLPASHDTCSARPSTKLSTSAAKPSALCGPSKGWSSFSRSRHAPWKLTYKLRPTPTQPWVQWEAGMTLLLTKVLGEWGESIHFSCSFPTLPALQQTSFGSWGAPTHMLRAPFLHWKTPHFLSQVGEGLWESPPVTRGSLRQSPPLLLLPCPDHSHPCQPTQAHCLGQAVIPPSDADTLPGWRPAH